MKRRLVIALLFIAALSVASLYAAPTRKIDNELTADEERESKALAELFVKRMAEKKDIAPLMNELFVSDSLDRYMNEPENNSFIFIERDVARRAGKLEARRYYVDTMNFWYLNDLYVYSRFSAKNGDPPADIYQLQVARQVKRTNDMSENIKTARQLRSYNTLMERLNTLLRTDVIRRKAEATANYKESVMEWDERFHHFKPWVTVCEKGCYGLPAGARLITINVPSFQLQIAKVGAGGEFKIISAMPYID